MPPTAPASSVTTDHWVKGDTLVMANGVPGAVSWKPPTTQSTYMSSVTPLRLREGSHSLLRGRRKRQRGPPGARGARAVCGSEGAYALCLCPPGGLCQAAGVPVARLWTANRSGGSCAGLVVFGSSLG